MAAQAPPGHGGTQAFVLTDDHFQNLKAWIKNSHPPAVPVTDLVKKLCDNIPVKDEDQCELALLVALRLAKKCFNKRLGNDAEFDDFWNLARSVSKNLTSVKGLRIRWKNDVSGNRGKNVLELWCSFSAKHFKAPKTEVVTNFLAAMNADSGYAGRIVGSSFVGSKKEPKKRVNFVHFISDQIAKKEVPQKSSIDWLNRIVAAVTLQEMNQMLDSDSKPVIVRNLLEGVKKHVKGPEEVSPEIVLCFE